MRLQILPVYLAVAVSFLGLSSARGQIDPQKRRLLQIGYNQPTEGRGPIAAYAFYYHNQPHFPATNITLRLAIAPIYVDSELGFTGLLGPNTDVGVGLSGGGFADSHSEIRQGVYRRNESFVGHGGEISGSLYHRFNPGKQIPLWAVFRVAGHQTFYDDDSDTDDNFQLPSDQTALHIRSGLRFGGKEPSLTEPLAMELSIWHELQIRDNDGAYGYQGDRTVEEISNLFWARGLLKLTFESEHLVELGLSLGATVDADRFSAYRMGGLLPFSSDFPLNIPGYYYQELSAERFILLNGEYSFPLDRNRNWRLSFVAATALVDYVPGLEQPGDWHSGLGGGISYISPHGSWLVSLLAGHGFDSIRRDGRGSNQVGLLFQYDFDAKERGKSRYFLPGASPYKSRWGERLFQ